MRKRWVHNQNFAVCWDGLKDTVGVAEGNIEKSVLLSNQQETQEGSSETYTQSTTESKEIKESARPAHKKEYPKELIEWFVGFTEGKGEWEEERGKNRVSFTIAHKEYRVLHYIRTNLGYGKIEKWGEEYKYRVTQREQVGYLIELFGGRVQLAKSQEKYKEWAEKYRKKQGGGGERESQNQRKREEHTESAWLAGWVDARGSFIAEPQGGTYKMKIRISGAGEPEVQRQLRANKIPIEPKEGTKGMEAHDTIEAMMRYLDKRKLKTEKQIAYTKWKKLYRVLEEGGRGKSKEEITRKAQEINEKGKEDEDEEKVQT